MMGDHDVTLQEQLEAATSVDACFCISCGQPDEPGLHDPARCAAMGGTNDEFTIAEALEVLDEATPEEPDLEDSALALYCIIVATKRERERLRVGDGVPDAALAIGEHAFRAGHEAGVASCATEGFAGMSEAVKAQLENEAWDAYEPSEEIKALS